MSEIEIVTQHKSDSSIEITKNSKGFTYSIKAYGTTPQAIAEKLNQLKQTAEEIVKQSE